MLDFSHYALYDSARTMRLSLEPMTRTQMLADFPGEIVISSPLLATRLGCEAADAEAMQRRREEFAALDEESALRIWLNRTPARDGRIAYVSAPDSLPDVEEEPDWGISSAGFLIGSVAEIAGWVKRMTDADDPASILRELSRILSGCSEPPHAAQLTDLSTGAVIMTWPVRCANPIHALSAAAESWPEVRYREEDFDFSLKSDLAD